MSPVHTGGALPLTSAEGPDLDIFKAALRATAAPIKATLLDQERAVLAAAFASAADAAFLCCFTLARAKATAASTAVSKEPRWVKPPCWSWA